MDAQELKNINPCQDTALRTRNSGCIVNHQRNCKVCTEWLFDNDRESFDDLLRRTLKSKTSQTRYITSFAITKKYCLDDLIANDSQHTIFQEIQELNVPIRYPQEAAKLPNNSGIYLVVISNKRNERVAYIGSSLSIHNRILCHHVEEIQMLIDAGVELLIYCLLFPLEGTEQAMRETEMYLIRELQPTLNKRF